MDQQDYISPEDVVSFLVREGPDRVTLLAYCYPDASEPMAHDEDDCSCEIVSEVQVDGKLTAGELTQRVYQAFLDTVNRFKDTGVAVDMEVLVYSNEAKRPLNIFADFKDVARTGFHRQDALKLLQDPRFGLVSCLKDKLAPCQNQAALLKQAGMKFTL